MGAAPDVQAPPRQGTWYGERGLSRARRRDSQGRSGPVAGTLSRASCCREDHLHCQAAAAAGKVMSATVTVPGLDAAEAAQAAFCGVLGTHFSWDMPQELCVAAVEARSPRTQHVLLTRPGSLAASRRHLPPTQPSLSPSQKLQMQAAWWSAAPEPWTPSQWPTSALQQQKTTPPQGRGCAHFSLWRTPPTQPCAPRWKGKTPTVRSAGQAGSRALLAAMQPRCVAGATAPATLRNCAMRHQAAAAAAWRYMPPPRTSGLNAARLGTQWVPLHCTPVTSLPRRTTSCARWPPPSRCLGRGSTRLRC